MKSHLLSFFFVFVLFVIVIESESCEAQQVRYQLGKQVIAFEEHFETVCSDPSTRGRPLGPLQSAVRAFFAMSLPEAEREIDQARLTLFPADQQADFQALLPLRLVASSRWVDVSSPIVKWSLTKAYDEEKPLPKALRLVIRVSRIDDPTHQEQKFDFEVDGSSWSASSSFALPGDYFCRPELIMADKSLTLPWTIISSSENRNARVEAVAKGNKEPSANEESNALLATIKLNASVLRSLTKDRYLETDYPANQMLADCEFWQNQFSSGASSLSLNRQGQFWLDVGQAKRSGIVRIQLPQTAASADRPLPVIVAYHGAGGSENMFFDAYGAGRVVSFAKENQCLLIAPRQPILGSLLSLKEMLDEVEKLVPIDRQRVAVVGHSMGAAQAISQLDKNPGQASHAVILGGGRSLSKPDAWSSLRVFAAAGDKDFGRSGLEAFAQSARQAKADCVSKIYENTEHLGIVQVAWSDVFEWLGVFLSVGK